MLKSLIAILILAAFVSANINFKAGPECVACEYAVTYLEKQISNNATSTEIVAALEKVCDIAPASFKQSCDSLIEEYAPTILYLLIKAATPEAVCKAIKAC